MQLTRKRNGILASYEILHLYFHFKGYCFSNFETQRSLRSKLISLPAVGGGGGGGFFLRCGLEKSWPPLSFGSREKKKGKKRKREEEIEKKGAREGGGGGRWFLVSDVDLNKVSRHIHLEARRKKRGNKGKNQAAMKSFITDTIYTYYTRSFKQI